MEDNYSLVNVNIIAMRDENILYNATVRVKNGIIIAINKDETDYNGHVIDCKEGFLLPAFCDMHIHMEITDDNGDYILPSLYCGKNTRGTNFNEYLKLYIANGVTLVRNMSGHSKVLEIKEKIKNNQITGPRIVTAAPLTDGYPPVWDKCQIIKTKNEARQAVLKAKNKGYDFFKIYNNLSLECFEEILKTASEVNMPVCGHIPKAVGAHRIIRSSISSVEHVKAFPLTNIEEAALAKIWMVPTLIVQYYNDLFIDEKNIDLYMNRYLNDCSSYISRDLKEYWIEMIQFFRGYNFHLDRTHIEYQKSCKKYTELGGKLLCGTDALLPFVVPGFSLHEELRQLVSGGLSPYEALKTATCNPAEYLNVMNEFGTVEVGKKAELVLLSDNPLEDIRNTKKVNGVLYKGKWLFKQDLDKMLQEVKETSMQSFMNFDNN